MGIFSTVYVVSTGCGKIRHMMQPVMACVDMVVCCQPNIFLCLPACLPVQLFQ